MKIRIEIDPDLTQEDVIIRASSITPEVARLQELLTKESSKAHELQCYKDEREYFIELNDILFMETSGSFVTVHTRNDMYKVKYKLYELEELLPAYFVRVAKSSIVNSRKIYSIERNITGASEVSFVDTKKVIYVSRGYYKVLQEKLEDRRYF